ncbi:hypothetical protein [Oricola cellulosilytica]|uniref:Uncharacterized protein n=1 Tax=Oricola cellulosilytica TaxID=1429082 RepID=A0A4R0PES4_9HYPH|nr:hypothetical protein [Oricola cellulosilytica]TCD15138.1 hypothetical protein E0D97_06205 [Oricola cellulosilytica]
MKPDELEEHLNRLVEALDRREITIFSRDEAGALKEIATLSAEDREALREITKFWRAAKGSAWLAGLLMSGLKWAAGLVAIWIAFKAGLLDWLRGELRP